MHRKNRIPFLLLVSAAVLLTSCSLLPEIEISPRIFSDPGGEILSSEGAVDAGKGGEGSRIERQQAALLPQADVSLQRLSGIPYYQITGEIFPEESHFSGQMTLFYTNQEAVPLTVLNFRLFPNGGKSYGDGSLTVENLAVNSQPLESDLSVADSVLTAVLPDELPAGKSIELTADFQGEIPRDFGGGYGLYNQTDGVISLSGWFPLLAVYDDQDWNLDPVSAIGDSVYSDAAFFEVTVTVPEDAVVIATGEQTAQEKLSTGRKQIRYLSGPARDFYLILSSDFQRVVRQAGETEINSYYLGENQQAANLAADIAADSVEIFNHYYGLYPYTELDVVEAPMRYAAGIEFPGVILVGRQYYQQYQDTFFAIVTAHEVAHQWWYNVVGSDVIDEPWMDEALVTFSSNLYFEKEISQGMYDQLIDYYRRVVEQSNAEESGALITDSLEAFEATPERRSLYSPIVYSKGALFYAELREKIGDEAFFSALQGYYAENLFGIGTPEELLGWFETASGEDLDEFYQLWLYR